jgi:polysaccharide export outer membrane protein
VGHLSWRKFRNKVYICPSLETKNLEMIRIWLFFGLALLVFNACVPAKKLVYLQKEDELKKKKYIPTDSILRSHTLALKEYRIQPLDILSVSFETLSDENDAFDFLSKLAIQQGRVGGSNAGANGIVVNTEGAIEFAVLGDIKVAGLSIFEAQDSIKAVAAKFIPDVIVRVRMLNFRFTVLGQVNGERTVVSPTTRLTMMEAIGQAGGLGELADRSRVKVVRQNGDRAEIFYVNLLEEDYLESPYYYVQQNDVIIVPPLKQRTFRQYFTSNLGIITTSISFVLLIYTLTR